MLGANRWSSSAAKVSIVANSKKKKRVYLLLKTRILFLHFQQLVLAPTIAEVARPHFWLRQTALTSVRDAGRRAPSPAEPYLY